MGLNVIIGHKIDDAFFELKIDIEAVDSLYIHEEIVPSILRNVKNMLKEQGFQIDPIIVDDNTGVILDGMHRYKAISELGYDYILVAKVDYMDKNILIKNWYRTYKINKKTLEIVKIVKQTIGGLELETIYSNESLDEPESDELLSIWVNGLSGSIKVKHTNRLNIWEKYQFVKKIENRLNSTLGIKPDFRSDEIAINDFKNNRASLVLATPKVSKQDVVKFAMSKKPFPPKTTRHILPARPLFVNVPLTLLKRNGVGGDLEEKREILKQLLRQKTLIKLKGRVTIDRYYEEKILFVFA